MPRQKAEPKWTLVQHSGYGYKGDPQFEKGLEVREVNTHAEQAKIEQLGGVLFDTYKEAEDAEELLPYVNNPNFLIPNAQGEFATFTIDGLRIYLPIRKIVG